MKSMRSMKSKKRKIGITVLCVILLAMCTVSAEAASYKSYYYIKDNNGIDDVNAPTAYVATKVYDSNSLGIDLVSPEDICLDANGNFYVLDSGTGYIFSFTSVWKKRYTIFGYLEEGNFDPTSLKKPQGICVQGNVLYVAETEGNRILKFDINTTQLIGTIDAPVSDMLGSDFVFKPKKIAVDTSGRIFVVAENVNKGLMELTQSGKFVGYVGSNTVVTSALELLWKKILSDQQNDSRLQYVPVEYSNIALDSSGFIFAVTSASDVDDPIRRLNPSGEDVLVRNAVNGTGVVGDALYATYTTADSTTGPSSFVDITVNDQGIYFALDCSRGRIFAYDEDGNMLFEFGGINTYQMGTFTEPCAIEIVGHTIYVVDRGRQRITVFEPTEYALTIMEATKSYVEGDYETSLQQWDSLLKKNCNFDLAYVKAGFCLYRMGQYKEAMDYFKLANARDYYTKAFVKYRKELLSDNFTLFIAGLVGGIVFLIVLIRFTHKQLKKRREKTPSERSKNRRSKE